MNKKRPFESKKQRERRQAAADDYVPPPSEKGFSITQFFLDRGVRETIESVLVAVMLALLFRAYEAEAFIIPTGSMAPTLQGRHKDVVCDRCGYAYRAGASGENEDARLPAFVVNTTCPICRYSMHLDPDANPNQSTFSGDRILVSKFAYELAEPRRWDVIVFKFPDNAKQNYIKRLIGLPGELILIENGDINVAPFRSASGSVGDPFKIARKDDPRKLLAMLQMVDDTDYIAEDLKRVNWPSRWNQWGAGENERQWQVDLSESTARYSLDAPPQQTAWLRYRHLVPRTTEWDQIRAGRRPARIDSFRGELITDYYPYNDPVTAANPHVDPTGAVNETDRLRASGLHWVGDLAVECDIQVNGDSGTLLLDLVEGGVHFECAIDVATGQASLRASDPVVTFVDADANTVEAPTAETKVKGPGSYHLRFANADDRLYLWVNNRPIEFPHDAIYSRDGDVLPRYSRADPGDAEPIGIGSRGVPCEITRLKVLRDIYYISLTGGASNEYSDLNAARFNMRALGWPGHSSQDNVHLIRYIIEHPETWEGEGRKLFQLRKRFPSDAFPLEASDTDRRLDQFFPLGDNSPQSSDARLWPEAYVTRDLLIGKALYIYWPHSWWRPIPFWPNFKRMRLIR